MRICSTLLTVRETQIKATIRYHFTPVRMAIIKKSINNKFWRTVQRKGNLQTLLVGIKISAASKENSVEVP